jgi:hypothetical protein
MKGQLFIAETEHLLDDAGTQHLLGRHAVCSASAPSFLSLAKVLQNQFAYDWIVIQNTIYGFQFGSTGMSDSGFHQRHLFFALFAVAPAFCLGNIFKRLELDLYYFCK